MRKGTTITGYIFPNPPEKWTNEEKRFALALRGLFDTLFQKMQAMSSEIETLKEQINEVTEDVSD
jgi:hypothetical protein